MFSYAETDDESQGTDQDGSLSVAVAQAADLGSQAVSQTELVGSQDVSDSTDRQLSASSHDGASPNSQSQSFSRGKVLLRAL